MKKNFTDKEKQQFFNENAERCQKTGTAIQKMRLRLRLSKVQLAKMAGICTKTLTKLENGHYIRRFKTVSKSCFNALDAVSSKDSLVCLEQTAVIN